MTIDEDSIRLRTIAAAVMAGDCPQDEYLAERRRLIDLHAGEASPDVLVTLLDESAFAPGDTDTRPVPVVVPGTTEPGATESGQAELAGSVTRHYDLLIGVGVLLVVLGLLWGLIAWLW